MNPPPPSEDEVFQAALDLPPGPEREALLDRECRGNLELRARVGALLQAYHESDQFLEEAAYCPGASSAERSEERIGSRIGPYTLERKLGEGGYGVVYLAEQRVPIRRRVALKVIKMGMDTRAMLARFDAERQLLAMLDHPGVARIYDAGSTGSGAPYYVMEFVDGARVTDFCNEQRLSARERVELMIQVGEAVQHAHQKGIIHRDLKPSNILMTLQDGKALPKVIDFGIAKLMTQQGLEEGTLLTQTGHLIGTPAYMSPEQAELRAMDVDTRSDVYALGVLLYELLTGRAPFDADELAKSGWDEMRRMLREKEPVRPSTRLTLLEGEELERTAQQRRSDPTRLIHCVKGDLDWIVMKCLEKDRARRYATANGLALDLERFLASEPIAARPPSTVYRFKKIVLKHKTLSMAALTVFLSVSAAALIATTSLFSERRAHAAAETARVNMERERDAAVSARTEAEEQRALAQKHYAAAAENEARARRALYAADMNLAQQALADNNLGLARSLLDRHRPEPGRSDLRGWEWRYLWKKSQGDYAEVLVRRETRANAVALSHDERYLAVGYWNGVIELWDFPARKLLRIGQENGPPAKLAFSPVEDLLACGGPDNAVRLYRVEGFEELKRLPAAEAPIGSIAFSPDGMKLAYRTRGGLFFIWDVAEGRLIHENLPFRCFDSNFSASMQFSPDGRHVWLATGAFEGLGVTKVSVETGQAELAWKIPANHTITSLAVSPDGRWVATSAGYSDQNIYVWDALDGAMVAELAGHSSFAMRLLFTADGERLFSGGADQNIREWSTATWQETKVMRGHEQEVHALVMARRGERLVSGGKDGAVMLWNTESGPAERSYHSLPSDTLYASFASPRDHLRLIKTNWSLSILNYRTVQEELLPDSGVRPLGRGAVFRFFPDYIVGIPGDGTYQIYDASGPELRLAHEVRQVDQPISHADYRPEQKLMIWCELTGLIHGKWFETGETVLIKTGIPKVRRVAAESRLRFVSAENADLNLYEMWDLRNGKPLRHELAGQPPMGESFLPRHVSVTFRRTQIAFFNAENWEDPAAIIRYSDSLGAVAISPDGKLAAAASESGAIYIFDLPTRRQIATLRGHQGAVFSLYFSKDHRRLFAGGGGISALSVWDLTSQQGLISLPGTGMLLGFLHFDEDENHVLLGSRSMRDWQIWMAPSFADIEASELAGRWRGGIPGGSRLTVW